MFDRSAHVYDLLYSFKEYGAEAKALVELIRARSPRARSLLDVARGRLPDVPLVLGGMRTFDLGRRFDAVTCLFSSVGYLPGPDDLSTAVGRMASHLAPGGVLVVDGWIRPDRWREPGGVHALAETSTDTAAARVSLSRREGSRTILEMRYLMASLDGFETASETHVLTLFTDREYREAFRAAGLQPEIVASPMGDDRDRYVAVAPT